MKQTLLLSCFICLLFTEAHSQFSRYIIQFKNKGTNPFSIANPSAYLSARAVARRTKFSIAIDSSDLPITPRYIDSIRRLLYKPQIRQH
jgi:serine protease AprX